MRLLSTKNALPEGHLVMAERSVYTMADYRAHTNLTSHPQKFEKDSKFGKFLMLLIHMLLAAISRMFAFTHSLFGIGK